MWRMGAYLGVGTCPGHYGSIPKSTVIVTDVQALENKYSYSLLCNGANPSGPHTNHHYMKIAVPIVCTYVYVAICHPHAHHASTCICFETEQHGIDILR